MIIFLFNFTLKYFNNNIFKTLFFRTETNFEVIINPNKLKISVKRVWFAVIDV